MSAAGVLADLATLIRNPRRWWRDAGRAPCPVCGQGTDVTAREWYAHRATHPPWLWRACQARRGRP
jgi:hypothetical protein